MIAASPTETTGIGNTLYGSKLVYLNGTTDSVIFTIYQSSGAAVDIQSAVSGSGTYFSAVLVTTGNAPYPSTNLFNYYNFI
jgi:hypothetical protein